MIIFCPIVDYLKKRESMIRQKEEPRILSRKPVPALLLGQILGIRIILSNAPKFQKFSKRTIIK